MRYVCQLCGPIQPTRITEDKRISANGLPGLEANSRSDTQDPVASTSRSAERNETAASQDVVASTSSAEASNAQIQKSGGDKPDGYELCASCVENAGHQHAIDMSQANDLASSASGVVREGLGRLFALRHAFGEVIRSEKGGWKEVGTCRL
jgi:hypothetical protein